MDRPVRCADCGHPGGPMSEGTWEGDPPQGVERARTFCEQRAFDELRTGNLTPRLPVVHFSPCDEGCRHGGPGRELTPATSRSVTLLEDPWSEYGGVAYLTSAGVAIEASWRLVDVRTLGWPHDLRPERLAILCLRCLADRSSHRSEMPT